MPNNTQARSPFGKLIDMMQYKVGRRVKQRKWQLVLTGVSIGLVFTFGALLSIHLVFQSKPTPTTGVNGAKTIALPLKKQPMHDGLELSVDPSLRKLAEYEKAYGGAVASRVMVFASLPANSQDAAGDAMDMSTKLQEFAKYRIQPLVIMEPTVNGSSINVSDFAAGKYDASLTEYFTALKNHGITDAMMGVWVHFPEDNIPEWGNTDAGMFQTNVVKAARIQKSVFPNSQISILLNSESFRSDDVERNYGTFSSLLPYVRGLPKGLFSSFGLQGFPWISAADDKEQNKLLSPAQYLNANLAREAAKSLGVKDIWLNTGTFYQMYTQTASRTVTFTPAQRQTLLNGVLAQMKVAQGGGYHVSINLFSFNGSATGEETDWSYWHTGQTPAQAPATAVFKSFAEQVYENGGQLWLFDSD